MDQISDQISRGNTPGSDISRYNAANNVEELSHKESIPGEEIQRKDISVDDAVYNDFEILATKWSREQNPTLEFKAKYHQRTHVDTIKI